MRKKRHGNFTVTRIDDCCEELPRITTGPWPEDFSPYERVIRGVARQLGITVEEAMQRYPDSNNRKDGV